MWVSCGAAAMLSTGSPTDIWYHILQQPHFPKKTLAYLEQQHALVKFLDAISMFVKNLPQEHQFFELNTNDHFDVFSNVVISQPPYEHMLNKLSARIHLHPQCSNGVHRAPTLARFDTILVHDDRYLSKHRGLHGRSLRCRRHILTFLLGLCVAEVHAIFKLPSHLGNYPHSLAYIHWFKLLQMLDNDVKMFHISCSRRQWQPNAEVIPVDCFIQPCHLIPRYPSSTVNPLCICGHALTQAETFYLNRYIDSCIFKQYRVHT